MTPAPSNASVDTSYTTSVGEQLLSDHDYSVHELPGSTSNEAGSSGDNQDSVLVNRALLARVEMLESENDPLQRTAAAKREGHHFRIEDIQHDDKLIRFYTGFVSYAIFLVFF